MGLNEEVELLRNISLFSKIEPSKLKLLAFASERVRLGVSPHAPYTVSAPLLERVSEYARSERLPVSMHVAESAAEVRFVRDGGGPFAEHLRGRGIRWEGTGVSPVAYLHDLGVFEARPLLVHLVQLAEGDVEAIAASGATAAHCPKSNAKLRHGVAPLQALLDAGVAVGLGTDSAVSNNGGDLIEEARFGALAARAAAAAETAGSFGGAGSDSAAATAAECWLERMTLGGATALGLEAEVGSLETGKRADLTAVGLDSPHLLPVHDPAAAVVFGAGAADVRLTMVGGEVLYDGEAVRTLDEAELLRRAWDFRLGG